MNCHVAREDDDERGERDNFGPSAAVLQLYSSAGARACAMLLHCSISKRSAVTTNPSLASPLNIEGVRHPFGPSTPVPGFFLELTLEA